MSMYKSIVLCVILLLAGCEAKTQQKQTIQKKNKQERYVDFERFKQGRPCGEVRFMCLPESTDKSWQEQNLSDGLDTFALTPEVNKAYDARVKAWNKKYNAFWDTHDYEAYWKTHSEEKGEFPVKMSSLSKAFFDRVEAKRFLVDMEQRLEKEFPGFWRDVPKAVRYRWIRRAMNKAKKLGYNESKPNGIIELCARIGLDFDRDPKWESMVKFLSLPNASNLGYDIVALEYIDFTIFDKNTDAFGRPITDWSLRDALGYLPRPKRPIPKLNDIR